MQQFLLPDYLDRTKVPKDDNLASISLCCALTDYMKIIDENQINIDLGYADPKIDGISLKNLLPYVAKDESLKVFLRTFKAYKENPTKNFIFTKNLSKALEETKLDIKCKFLPKEFTAFLDVKEMYDQDGDHVKGVFVHITQDPLPMMFLGCLCYSSEYKVHTISHLNIPITEPDQPLAEIVKSYDEISSEVDEETIEKLKKGEYVDILNKLDKKVEQAKYHKHLHTIFNCILYIHYSPELCVAQENDFSTKKSKRETQKKIFTPKKFFIMGKDFSFPKEYTCGEVGVSGHMRWQPHGPERSLLKHIYIKPHTRNYNKQEELA
ncbi:hypothetical protein N9948_01905 [bacterium]|nr:hypothetical protein [bacterium]